MTDSSGLPSQPPVVAVMVVHEPGDWLQESLRGLAAQDYGSLQVLVLLTGTSESPGARAVLDTVESVVPQAVVRFVGSNPGYAAACNSVLNLVQGDSGFFCFLHDDVELMPTAISAMVEEMYRSNAGIVGPKLVHWDNPSMIQSVGHACDRFGVELPYADVGELDQEQHDFVQDVFVLPSSCMMVRADLFRVLGGFETTLHSSGVDLDVCWRAHSTGARVVIVPAAVARHREAMVERTEDASSEHDMDSGDYDVESTRVQTVMSLSTRGQLLTLLPQMLVFTLARSIFLLVTGRPRRAIAELRAVLTAPLSVGDIRRRRDGLSDIRTVDGDEVRALQILGSSHTTAFFRARARRAGLAQSQEVDEVRTTTPRGAYIMWSSLVILLIVGSRSIVIDGSSMVGQFVPFTQSARDAWSSYVSGWWSAGFGQVSALPTGIALVGTTIAAFFGNSGIAQTMSILALPFVGWLGAWRFASVMGTRGGRIAAVMAYAAAPLPYAAIASGRWGVLLFYALFPWMMHLLRMLVGHADINSRLTSEAMVVVAPFTWRRWCAGVSLLCAIAFAFEPGVVVVLPVVGVAIAVTSLAQGLKSSWSARWVAVTSFVTLIALVLNMPWTATFVRSGWWEAFTGAPVEGGRDLGLWALAQYGVGHFWGGFLSLGLFAAVVGSLVLVRGVRAVWALRGASLVAVGLLLAILDDAALLPAHLPEPGVLLVPVAFGVAMCAATMGAALAVDLGRGRISWRQPLGVLVGVAFAIGALPAPLNAVDGSWNQPKIALPQLLEQLPTDVASGDYRTLFIGDSRVLPGAPLNFGWGISYSVVNGAQPQLTDSWETPPTRARDNSVAALYGIVRGQTSRAGRLLAPLSVRFIVVPVIDGGQSTRDHPIAAPQGLIEALSRQLDLRRRFTSPDLVVFENTTWVPVRSQLTEAGAASSQSAGAESMIASDISGATPFPSVPSGHSSSRVDVQPGTLHLAVPFTTRWKVTINDQDIPVRPAFGLTNAYDVSSAGAAQLSYQTSTWHRLFVVIQVAAWAVFVVLAFSRRRRPRTQSAETVRHEPALSFSAGAGS